MSAIYAELHVGGHVYPLRRCTYGVSQATGPRGRPIEQVRHGHIEGEMDVPRDQFMEQWAATAYMPLGGYIIFSGGPGEPALETVSWAAGQCVFYREEFHAGSITDGSYICQWRIVAAKLVFSAGPPKPFVAAAAREHGTPPVAAVVAPLASPLPAGYFRKSDPDPVRTLLGPGRLSHPSEWNATIAMLEHEGVEVAYRSGAMGYWSVPDAPGRMLLDPDMSISALRHETRHFLDDKALGFLGMGYYFTNLDERWKFEFNAYMEEINFVRGLREFTVGHELVGLARQEKNLIYLKDYTS